MTLPTILPGMEHAHKVSHTHTHMCTRSVSSKTGREWRRCVACCCMYWECGNVWSVVLACRVVTSWIVGVTIGHGCCRRRNAPSCAPHVTTGVSSLSSCGERKSICLCTSCSDSLVRNKGAALRNSVVARWRVACRVSRVGLPHALHAREWLHHSTW